MNDDDYFEMYQDAVIDRLERFLATTDVPGNQWDKIVDWIIHGIDYSDASSSR